MNKLPPKPSETEASSSPVRAVERAIDILSCFTPETSELNVTELKRITGLSRPTLYRLLQTLEHKGLIYSSGDPLKFQLGFRIWSLAQAWSGGFPIVQVAEPLLDDLWRATDETVALMVTVSPSTRFCAIELRGQQPISFSRGTGYTETMYKGASGKVILAHLPFEQSEVALRDNVAKELREPLRNELKAIRENGYAVTFGEIIPGLAAVAAPVLNSNNYAEGSICVFGTESRLKGENLTRIIDLTCESAMKISKALGFVSDDN